LEAALADPVRRHREWIEAEGAEVLMARGMNGAAIEVAAELDGFALGLDHFFKARNEHVTAHRRRQCRRQEAVIAPCVRSEDRRRREAALAVRLEPFQTLRALEV